MPNANEYTVLLTNYQGATFDNTKGTNLRELRSWASGRGKTFEFGQWHKYSVCIYKNGEPFMDYLTQ